MIEMLSPWVRIALRIIGGFFIGWGMDPEAAKMLWTDPQLIGAVCIALSEGWYLVARRMGWSK